ncbi:putative solute carrier family 35 member [Psilocybe cubensis]|uniref:Solute carrier family 35 member n=1 Tax=Psilocybe cubensis TaxID=181762 RepID=A0ACB8GX83_PSICU|nr:putative solute carrier family 35 member [Psilocybe cubensis]KAH9479570.1 putative solute carrier family 35 member [Psilocybe cubensis]
MSSIAKDDYEQDNKLGAEGDQDSVEPTRDTPRAATVRPELVYTSPKAFARSFAARWRSVWTRPFVLSLLAGQLVSLCITCTNVTTTELVSRGWTLSTTQGIFFWAIPVCLFVSWVYMRTKYHWTQLLGVFICIGGLGLLVASDEITQKGWEAVSRAKGDGFMIAGATLYGITNASEEFLVRKRPLFEVVGQLGMWGFVINGIQSSALEWRGMKEVPWTGDIIGLLMAFTAAMLILYTVAPMLYRMASSAYFNLSLLSSDFYGLLRLQHYRPYWLYFISFAIIICGLITYFWHSTPEEQGILDPKAPSYIDRKRMGFSNVDAEQGIREN